MAKKETFASGTKQEVDTFHEVMGHYMLAKEDLEPRIKYFNKIDELFRSYINESSWPYNSEIFDPRTFTTIFEKTSRLFANKPRGRLVPREGGDSLGARICNELLDFQWDDNERVDGQPMLAKWAQMDQNARKYGVAFGLAKWHYERRPSKKDKKANIFYDGPNFKPLINRDCLPNPAYSTVKNWFQYREYATLQELENVNDATRSKPVYKNLDIVRDKLREESAKGGDRRDVNYMSRNLSMTNRTDQRGRDEVFKTIEIVTEYRNDRWITFAPKYGVVIRDIDNPYDHGQIPIVMLKYYPVDDDIYGLSEIEPVEKLQKAVNALWSQYVDSINMGLYPILKVRGTGVQMHTLEFAPGKKWIMNDPGSDVVPHEQSATGISEFATTYRLLISSMQEGLGETSEGVSTATPGASDKTATEIRDAAAQRNARDNFNQIFLSEALKKQMMFWHTMDKQFMFSNNEDKIKVVRIVGKDAIRYFENYGLSGKSVSDEALSMLSDPDFEGINIRPEDLAQDSFPVKTAEGKVAKFQLEPGGDMGQLLVEPEDLAGTYDYIADIESMALPDEYQMASLIKQMFELVEAPVVQKSVAEDGYRVKTKELIEDIFEKLGIKDADRYFEKLQPQGGLNGEANAGGGVGPQAVPAGVGVDQAPGMAGGPQAPTGVQAPQQLG